MEKISSVSKKSAVVLLSIAGVRLLLHLLTNITGGYGYFRDELYYIACTEHIDWGYVDHPPLSVLVLASSRFVFGDSLFAIRFLPAVAGAATVYFTGLMARELGGGKFAQAVASLASLVSLIFLAMDSFFSMNAFDIFVWTLGAYYLIQLLTTESPKKWISLGMIVGLGLLNKTGVLWLGLAIFAAFLITPQRQWLKTRWPWLGGFIALILFLPYVVWNIGHGFPHLEFIRNATGIKYSSLSPLTFAAGQILLQNPVTTPVWISGLVYFLFSPAGKRFRILGFTYVIVLLILVLNVHSKSEYLSPAYSMLFAGGGVALEDWISKRSFMWLKPALILLVTSGLILAPAVVPILPVETYLAYADSLGIKPSTSENKRLEKLPQFYADMFGWQELTATVARVYGTLSEEEKKHCGIYGQNYGEAAAVDFFGPRFGLPNAISGHNNYWMWGPRSYTGDVMIVIGGSRESLEEVFVGVVPADTVRSLYAMPYENNLPTFVCRKLKRPLSELWPGTKHFE